MLMHTAVGNTNDNANNIADVNVKINVCVNVNADYEQQIRDTVTQTHKLINILSE